MRMKKRPKFDAFSHQQKCVWSAGLWMPRRMLKRMSEIRPWGTLKKMNRALMIARTRTRKKKMTICIDEFSGSSASQH